MIPIVVIAGPTASGKTALSIEIAKRFSGEIVSCDSMQIYKELNIGTAKPTVAECDGIPHHMIDIVNPCENFSVAEFCEKGHKIIRDIKTRGKLPVLVGGTGLYIDSLINNVSFAEETGDSKTREELYELAKTKGNDELFKILLDIDPDYAKTTHPNNIKRVARAIEFYRATGMTVTEHNSLKKEPIYKAVYFCIDWDREVLYDRINARVDIMVKDGLEKEARSLFEKYGDIKYTAFQSIGYKELFEYFKGEKTFEEAIDEIKQSSRHYAKRQLTWFRRNENIHWLEPDGDMVNVAEKIIKEELKL